MAKSITVHPLSCVPLYIEVKRNGILTKGNATGFIVEKNKSLFLITNWHVLTNRNSITNDHISSALGNPDTLVIYHHKAKNLGVWTTEIYPLFDSDSKSKLWKEHPSGRSVDVVAFPLDRNPLFDYYPMDLGQANTDLVVEPADTVSIIGFPFGMASSGRVAIWKTGHVASDLGIDYNDLPAFLVDGYTESGTSGSPVIALRQGFRKTSKGFNVGGTVVRFLGVHSSHRGNERGGLALVWISRVIDEILA